MSPLRVFVLLWLFGAAVFAAGVTLMCLYLVAAHVGRRCGVHRAHGGGRRPLTTTRMENR